MAEYWVEEFEGRSDHSVVGVNFYVVQGGRIVEVDQVVEDRYRREGERGGTIR